MKGIVLAGGLGTRLNPLTLVQNKHLLPVFDKPMIFYPLETLAKAGIKEVMIVLSGPFAGNFISLLKNGQDFGFKKLIYGYQDKPNGGIADALSICEEFVDGDNCCVILGDNTTDTDLSNEINSFKNNNEKPLAHIFLKKVEDPTKYGVASFYEDVVIKITEKPEVPDSNYAVTGLYIYDNKVFDFIKKCKPSNRHELEITDVNNYYINCGGLKYSILNGFWKDAGSMESLFEANQFWYEKHLNTINK